jgi:outer membrane protein TolC
LIFVLIFLINLSFSEVNEYNKVTLDLNTAIQMMIDNNGMYGASKKTIDYAKAKIEEARAAWYPKTEVTYLIAPIFEETGNALASNSDYSKWGVFTKIYGTVVQPLYTFGLISSYKSAALAYYDLEVARSNLTKNELVDQTKQFFYGLQLAYELIDVVEDAKSKLEGAIKTAEEKVLRNKMKREDLFALKSYNAKILTKVDEANRG